MRRSGWLLPIFASMIWLIAAAWPAGTVVMPAINASPVLDEAAFIPIRPLGELLRTSALYALGVTVLACILGWYPGLLLGRRAGSRIHSIIITIALFLPICLPAYVVYYCWWQTWPPGSPIFAWAAQHPGAIPLLRNITLVLALACWSWPLVSWCIGGSAAMVPAQHGEMLKLDAAPKWRCMFDSVRVHLPGLMLGAIVVFLTTMANTTCFDLAGIFTFGNELRAIDAVAAPPSAIIRTALPAMGLSALGAGVVWMLLHGRMKRAPIRTLPAGRATQILTLMVWLSTAALPIAILLYNLSDSAAIGRFWRIYGESTQSTLGLALVSGAVAAIIVLGLGVMWIDHRRWVRRLADAQALTWLAVALMPATVLGVALEAAFNIPLTLLPGSGLAGEPSALTLDAMIYRQPIILIFGHLLRFGFIAALLGRWLAAREPAAIGDLRRIDHASSCAGLLHTMGTRALAAALAAGAIVTVLSVGEIPVTARIHPPGSDPLSGSLLNAMHYQRPDTVIAAVLILLTVAFIASCILAFLLLPFARCARPVRRFAPMLLLLCLASCGRDDPNVAEPLDTENIFGATGISLGQFSYPRACAIDPEHENVFVIDKTARVQRFNIDGEPQHQWRMPDYELGKPVGLSVAPDGRIFVADTHYFRIIMYNIEGEELDRFGSYGVQPGQFIYTTDIAFGADGRIYIAEYGGNDRIQVFSPEGEFLFQFGEPGEERDQFSRPQCIAFNDAGDELYIADSCNHRMVVVSPEGDFIRSFGTPGEGAGELLYPYGFDFLPDGSLLIAEFGNNRLQRFSTDGQSLGLFGFLGAKTGELRYPWSVAVGDDHVFVLDSGNNRVQMIEIPD